MAKAYAKAGSKRNEHPARYAERSLSRREAAATRTAPSAR